MQVEHVHPPTGAEGGFIPAAAQLNQLDGEEVDAVVGADGAAGRALSFAPGLGSSQATHLDAESVLLSMQVEHFHPPAGAEGGFIPAAAQLNPPDDEDDDDEVGAKESAEEVAVTDALKSNVGKSAFGTANAACLALCELGPGPAPGEEVGRLKV